MHKVSENVIGGVRTSPVINARLHKSNIMSPTPFFAKKEQLPYGFTLGPIREDIDVADDKTNNETDRRALITAVAMAGAAAPLIAAPAQAAEQGHCAPSATPPRFVVDLGNVVLSEEATRALSNEIRKAAIAAVARAGVKPTVYTGPLPHNWWGYWIRDDHEETRVRQHDRL